MDTTVKNENAKLVHVSKGKNPKSLYKHQVDAVTALSDSNMRNQFRSMLVLPTGAGKTMIATTWLLSNAVDNHKKILWIAHRHLLLDQAAESFVNNSYEDNLYKRRQYRYRIISGRHDRPIHIKEDDDILIASKDSLVRSLEELDQWLEEEQEIYLVIDEAHHATAKSYRRIIDYIAGKSCNLKLIGLTATPFRTSEQEQGLLGKVFTDDIAYQIDLSTLIKKGILSTPFFESADTTQNIGESLAVGSIKSIERFDNIPSEIADAIANNRIRNRFIVDTYLDNIDRYGQTLVFALNRIHAITLNKLFNERNITSDYIISGTQTEFTGIDISNVENEVKIEQYRRGELRVLINVNILTEGTDLPSTQTVFLTRPTISSVLMTQMIGRALRGEQAGGTKNAYIVSFIDDWGNKIAWVNPESIMSAENMQFTDNEHNDKRREIRIIAIDKIEEFAMIANSSIDTTKLEALEFTKRIPVGMYMFEYIDENELDHNYQILVYDNSAEQYVDLINQLSELFQDYEIYKEYIDEDVLEELVKNIEYSFFSLDMIPPYRSADIVALVKFYAQKEVSPLFYPMDEVSRGKVDLSKIAQIIIDNNLNRVEEAAYVNSLWDNNESLMKLYYTNKLFMKSQLDTEINKITNPELYLNSTPLVVLEDIALNSLPLHVIHQTHPKQFKLLSDAAYTSAQLTNGKFKCKECGTTSTSKASFQIDHIKPMSRGGLSVKENLQLLCRGCNMRKSDRP